MVAGTPTEVGGEHQGRGTDARPTRQRAWRKRRRREWREWRQRARRVGSALLVLAALAGVGIGARAWFDTRAATDRTEAALEDARADLDGSRVELSTVNAQLAAARATLAGESWTLDQREGERDSFQATLDAISIQLVGLVAQRDVEYATLADGTTRLDALRRCLVGVAEALNQASVRDTGGVTATLGSIEGTCAEAGVTL